MLARRDGSERREEGLAVGRRGRSLEGTGRLYCRSDVLFGFCCDAATWKHGRVMSEEQKKSASRARPTTDEFRAFVASGWAPRLTDLPERSQVARYAAERRAAVSAAFPGQRLVIPAGGLKVRSNDTDYVFRPHSAFAHLTGLGSDREADAVLVLEPMGGDGAPGHEAVLLLPSTRRSGHG